MISNYSQEEQSLASQLFQENYDDLMIIARARRRRSNQHQTLMTIDILHESYLRLNKSRDWESREHFINSAALAIRNVIIDYARRKNSKKRGENIIPITYDGDSGLMPEFWETPAQIIEIADLMSKLEDRNPRWMRIVDARYFCGFTEIETSTILNLSPRTVRRDWKDARSWMALEMGMAS